MDLQLSKRGIRYGALPSRVDHRDLGLPFHLFDSPPASRWASRLFLTGAIGPTKNQGQQGSCTGHGGTSLGERLYRRWKATSPIFAPAFLYYNERAAEGSLADGDCGAQVVTSLSASDLNPGATGLGFCPETAMPYNDADFSTAPSTEALEAAKAFPGGSYHQIGNVIDNIKACIASDFSFVIGITVYPSFEGDDVASTGLIPYPNPNNEQPIGGHELHAGIGWDDTIQCPGSPNPGAVMVQNSWGTSWGITLPQSGERGGAWISYDYLANPNFCSDVRMSHLGKAW